jgi:hypothetical protein
MKRLLGKCLSWFLVLLLILILVHAVWQPVLPSAWIVKKMAGAIDRTAMQGQRPVVVQFNLSGSGGGVYSILAGPDKVEMIQGRTNQADLIVFMEATDFNNLMVSLARGQGDEYTFQSLIISKVLRFAGDMTVLKNLFNKTESKGGNP